MLISLSTSGRFLFLILGVPFFYCGGRNSSVPDHQPPVFLWAACQPFSPIGFQAGRRRTSSFLWYAQKSNAHPA